MNIHLNLKLVGNELPRFRDDIRRRHVDAACVARMKDGWINSYSAHLEYCVGFMQEALVSEPKQILECGSGFTTILLTVLAQEFKSSLMVIESAPEWSDIVRRSLRFLGLPFDHIVDAPIAPYDGFDWYGLKNSQFLAPFDFVVCDGPPGTTRGGRVGLLPVLGHAVSDSCVIVLDDAAREGELRVMEVWEQRFGANVELIGNTHPFAKVTLGRKALGG